MNTHPRARLTHKPDLIEARDHMVLFDPGAWVSDSSLYTDSNAQYDDTINHLYMPVDYLIRPVNGLLRDSLKGTLFRGHEYEHPSWKIPC